MTRLRVLPMLFTALCWQASPAGAAGIRGEPAAVDAARQLLAQAGGAEAWRSPHFEVRERVYLSSGAVAELRIARDLSAYSRVLESVRPGKRIVEWISSDAGWVERDGKVTPMSAAELAAERQGLRQEPYAIYHRIARDDPALRVELRDDGQVFFFDSDERLLCWFQRAPNGVLLAWGNFYDGAINQHYYGPARDFGRYRLPRFGISSSGSMRFEYTAARALDGPPAEPATERN
jgi:hypothetical protein